MTVQVICLAEERVRLKFAFAVSVLFEPLEIPRQAVKTDSDISFVTDFTQPFIVLLHLIELEIVGLVPSPCNPCRKASSSSGSDIVIVQCRPSAV